jgi:hypothetical protein
MERVKNRQDQLSPIPLSRSVATVWRKSENPDDFFKNLNDSRAKRYLSWLSQNLETEGDFPAAQNMRDCIYNACKYVKERGGSFKEVYLAYEVMLSDEVGLDAGNGERHTSQGPFAWRADRLSFG